MDVQQRIDKAKAIIEEKRSIILKQSGYKKFVDFLIEAYGTTAGLSKSNISKILGKLTDTENIPTREDLEIYEKKIEQFELAVDAFVRRFGEKANAYFNTKWYLYFFHKDDLNDPQVMLAQTVLEIDEAGIVELRNLPNSSNYEGRFELISGYLLIFNLEGETPGSKLHIKMLSGARPQELCLGLSLSFEHQRIISNTIVLQKRSIDEKLIPQTLSVTDPDFFSIDISIREYLARRDFNYLKIPQRIYSLKGLQLFLAKYERKKKTQFFEFTKPQVFISTPTSSIDKDILIEKSNVICDIKEEVKKKLALSGIDVDFSYPGEYDNNKTNEIIRYGKQILNIFEQLRHTKFFILIYDKHAVSRCLVELGWALSNTKVVLVFYERNQGFPHTLSVLENRNRFHYVKFEPFTGSVASNKEFIIDKMLFTIGQNFNDLWDI